MKSKKYEMEVEICGEYGTHTEDVPDELNYKGAPNLVGLTAVDRAKNTIQWFNGTRREHENQRKLIRVVEVTRKTIFDAAQ